MTGTRRPWVVFVRDIGPTFTFATQERAIHRAEQLLAVEHYAEVLVYSHDEPIRNDLFNWVRSVYRHDRQEPIFERFTKLAEGGAAWQPCDRLGNIKAREGCDRCACGCKYWEHDACIDCGAQHSGSSDLHSSTNPLP